MRDRPHSVARAGRPPAAASLDLVCLSAERHRLVVLVDAPSTPRAALALPWQALDPAVGLDLAAGRLARERLGRAPAWIESLGAFGDNRRHPSASALSVAYVAVLPMGSAAPAGMQWVDVQALGPLAPRQDAMLRAAATALRERMDLVPIAFRMLPAEFTLSELQEMYELLLGRRLHKASFRRALQGAYLVEPTESWRSEGRGRPAQLFRYAPRRRRGTRRSVRFELLQ